jgi:hypothetical protein
MTSLLVDPAVAGEIADSYLNSRDRRDRATVAAFEKLVTETDQLFRRISKTLHVRFTTLEYPYRDAPELIESATKFRTLEITTVAVDAERRHPVMGNELGGAYDRFRAVHDALGHAALRRGFDRDGEFAAWRAQERFHSPLARVALATELHGQHSVRWTTGQIAGPKAILFEPGLLRRARRGVNGRGR